MCSRILLKSLFSHDGFIELSRGHDAFFHQAMG